MAVTLTTNAGSVLAYVGNRFDRSLPKGGFSIGRSGDRLLLESPAFHTAIIVDVNTSLDGVTFTTLEELANALSNFSKGGGSGDGAVQSVTGDLVDNTDPDNPIVLTPLGNQILVDGVLVPNGGLVNATDVESLLFSYGNAIVSLNQNINVDAVADTVVRRTNIGAVNTATPQFPENAVNLGYLDASFSRFLGIYNDIESLNSAHPVGQNNQYAYVRSVDSSGDIHEYYYWNDLDEEWKTIASPKDDLYSNSEFATNKIWSTGGRIYRKVFNFMAAEGNNTLPIDIDGFTKVVHLSYIITSGSVRYGNTPDVVVSTDGSSITVNSSLTGAISMDVVLEYIK